MLVLQILIRMAGIAIIALLIFMNTDVGEKYINEKNIPIDNGSFRALTSLNITTDNPKNNKSPIFNVLDVSSLIFVVFLLIGYILLSFDIIELTNILKKIFLSTSKMENKTKELSARLKEMSETYYASGSGSLKSSVNLKKIPRIWKLLIEQIEMRIPFPDILKILGNSAALTRKEYDRSIKILAMISNLCPSFGVMGTVLGLIKVLGNLSDPANLGPSMSLALMTTFYGLFLSIFIFKPLVTHFEIVKNIEMNSFQSASFWMKNIDENKPSFYLEQKF